MSDAVERAAEAYWNAGDVVRRWADESEEQRETVRRRMRAAIASLREPTDAMADSRSFQDGEWSRRNVEAFIDEALK